MTTPTLTPEDRCTMEALWGLITTPAVEAKALAFLARAKAWREQGGTYVPVRRWRANPTESP